MSNNNDSRLEEMKEAMYSLVCKESYVADVRTEAAKAFAMLVMAENGKQ